MEMGRGEERVERVTWKLTLPYVKQKAKGNLLYGKKKKGFVRELPNFVKNILLHVVRDGLKKSEV